MASNIDLKKKSTENDLTLLRRFSRKVKSAGFIKKLKSTRYVQRDLSPYKLKKRKLKSLERHQEREKMIKLGKIKERRRY